MKRTARKKKRSRQERCQAAVRKDLDSGKY